MDGHTERVTTTPGEYESWSPAFSLNNDLYFTSNRDGKAEIYRLKNGSTERVTNTSGTFESWSPAFSLNNDLYFTSNRDGKTEIYRLKDGNTERVTNTPGQCESWGAVAKGQDIYFTSCENWGQYRVYVLNAEPTAVSDILSWTKKRWDKFP
jgi:Tol biopolymer transport system component